MNRRNFLQVVVMGSLWLSGVRPRAESLVAQSYQCIRKGLFLKNLRTMERTVIHGVASDTPRTTGGIIEFITTNVVQA